MTKVHFTNEDKTFEMKRLEKLWKLREQWVDFIEEGKQNCWWYGRCQMCRCKVNWKVELWCQYQVWGDEDLEVETLI